MSKSNFKSGYYDPLTTLGVRLAGEELFTFHLHEVGYHKLSTGWSHRGVRSPYWRLYWNDRPGAWIECAGRSFEVGPTRILLVPSHAVFDTHGSMRPATHFWIHFSLHPDLAAKDNVPLFVPCQKALTRQVLALARKVERPASSTTRRFYHLCSALLHQVFAASEVESHQPRLPAKLYALLHEIESSLARSPAVSAMALRVGMSRGGFIRWFQQYMEISPGRYLLSRRIDHACRLLKFSSSTIEEISESLGFANRSHFSRAFQRQMGSGPAFFRKS